METPEKTVVEAEEIADERDTYYDFKTAVRVAAWAKGIGVGALLIGFLKAFIFVYRYISAGPAAAPRTAELLLQVGIEAGYWLVLGAVFFILLQAIAQGIFFLMDLEENTR
jgi:hypothetical protein